MVSCVQCLGSVIHRPRVSWGLCKDSLLKGSIWTRDLGSLGYDRIDPSSLPTAVHPRLRVPLGIPRPGYLSTPSQALSQDPGTSSALLKDAADLRGLQTACALARDVLVFAKALVREGLSTQELDERGTFPSWDTFPAHCSKGTTSA